MPKYERKLSLIGALRLRDLLKQEGLDSLKKIAEKFRVNYSTIQRLFARRATLSNEMLAEFVSRYHWTDKEVEFFTESAADASSVPTSALSEEEYRALVNEAQRLRNVPDLKNIVVDATLSETLLFGSSMPPLVESVKGTIARNFEKPIQKDNAVTERDNHFLQISCSLIFSWPGGVPHVLAYNRTPISAESTQFQNVQGFSHLWAASYEVGTNQAYPTMERWLAEVARLSEPEAKYNFVSGDHAHIRKLLSYKLTLAGLPDLSFSPAAVITNDMRPKRNRIYTQYWFLGQIEIDQKPRDMCAYGQRFSVSGVSLRLLPLHQDEKIFYDPAKSEPNRMDVLAWRYLQGRTDDLQMGSADGEKPIGRARLIPGFNLIKN